MFLARRRPPWLILLCFLCFFAADARPLRVVVAADGSGDFRTVQQAVDHVADNNSRPVVIQIKPGVYHEQVRVSAGKRYITFRGENARNTVLTYRLSAQQAGNTRLAFSTLINADDFRAENLTFENSFGTGSQAVALFVDADRASFKNCRFLGWQDTLFVNGSRHFFKDCYIEGHVDFIFGTASAVFENCTIHSKGPGYVTAHYRTSNEEDTGFVFIRSRLTGENTGSGVFLGRPWRPYARQAVGTIAWADAQNKPDEWYASAEALRIADNVLLYQRSSGGWPKNIDMAKPLSESNKASLLRDQKKTDSTIDNGATYTQLSFLARVYTAQRQERFRESFLKGLDYLLQAQYANGGWPQFYPDLSGYYKHITYNDDAMIGVMKLLRDVAAAKPVYAFVDEARRERAAKAVEKGIECILKTQVIVNGKRTVWSAQHDEVTLAPAAARKYEVASLSGGESVGIVRFLMSIKDPSPAVVEAIEGAIAWFEQSQLKGIKWVEKKDSSGRIDRVVVQDPDGGSIWARFYEIGSNRPIFVGRDGVVKYSVAEIEHERRTGYSWYVDAPAKLLKKDYPAWRERYDSRKGAKAQR